ncbi:hypothetical protein DFP72DRAFT_801357 [Ephemerocybe angulata]|uniref:DNA breaking-rejoining enzyme n=1 Tax=Ephemerocybe angulata TaxID=980116 RepID=A0A8H6MG93_9AGAR|nr:hypothetical protein DFP72DRAFT_801357 [Tulosesus angulatus]
MRTKASTIGVTRRNTSTTRQGPQGGQRRYRPAAATSTSRLRPSGTAARDRLRLWTPIGARNTLDEHGRPTNLTGKDLEQILSVLEKAWAEGTREVYGSGLLTFHIFCDSRGIAEQQRAPAPSIVVSAFISDLAGVYAASTIRNYVFGVRAWHVLHGLRWEMNESEIEGLLKAASTMAPPPKKKRQPYTVDYISALRCGLDLATNPLHIAVFACLTTTFYTAARLGEFTVKTLSGPKSFKPTEHITPADVRVEVDDKGLRSTVFKLPWTKASATGEEVSWSAQDGDTDPDAALKLHMRVNSPPPIGPLFAYKDKSGRMKALTKAKFIQIVHAAADTVGLEHLQGHGIRIGSTLEYLLRGVPFDVMKVKGRWASDAFQLYLRKHAQILAPYMQARSHEQEEFVRITMPPVRRR